MNIFLASDAGCESSFDNLCKMVERVKSRELGTCKIAYIVTAANGYGYGNWRQSDTLSMISEKVKSDGGQLEIVEFENYLFEDFDQKFENADIIWGAGGQPEYLLYWMRRVGFPKKIKEMLNKEENAPIYVGSSAGSMVSGPSIKSAEWDITEPGEKGAGVIPGLGIVDFEIMPHYTDDMYEDVKNLWKEKNLKICLLKDGEQIIIEGKKNNFTELVLIP